MTGVGLRVLPPETPRTRLQPALAGLRLVRLHLASRRIPGAVAALAAFGAVLRVGLDWHWTLGSSNTAQQVPTLIEAGAACLIAVCTYSPFGEPERATGRWLPFLRLATAAGLTAVAVGALAAGAAGAQLPGGLLDAARNTAGLTGVGLIATAIAGSTLAWVGPMAYLVVAEYAIAGAWTTPWTWPPRPPADRGAAVCAAVVFAAGLAVLTARGARDPAPAGPS